MSKETDQSLVMISVLAGIFETYRRSNAFARVDIKRAIDTGFDACQRAIIEWPLMSNQHWIKSRREKFFAFIGDHPAEHFPPVALACMCERLTTDMLDRFRGSSGKIALVEPIAAVSSKIHDFCDSAGANFQAYELSDELLDRLYEIIELKEFA